MTFFDNPRLDKNGVPYGGKLNYFIEDHDGKFMGGNYSLIPSSYLGEKLPDCEASDIYNGYFCKRNDFLVVEFENTASKDASLITWPISVSPIKNY